MVDDRDGGFSRRLQRQLDHDRTFGNFYRPQKGRARLSRCSGKVQACQDVIDSLTLDIDRMNRVGDGDEVLAHRLRKMKFIMRRDELAGVDKVKLRLNGRFRRRNHVAAHIEEEHLRSGRQFTSSGADLDSIDAFGDSVKGSVPALVGSDPNACGYVSGGLKKKRAPASTAFCASYNSGMGCVDLCGSDSKCCAPTSSIRSRARLLGGAAKIAASA